MNRSHPRVQEWIRTIRYAIEECGITLLDTAPWYGHGTSEVVVGWALEEALEKDPSIRDRITVNTKAGRYEANAQEQFDFSYDTILRSAERSVQRMKCGYLSVLQLHDPEFAPTLRVLLDETIPALLECKKRGYCRALGLTGYPLEVQHQILEASFAKFGYHVFDQCLTYCHYNLHDTSVLTRPIVDNSDNAESYVEYCHRQGHGMTVLAAAPLSMGLLTPNGPPEWHPAQQPLKDACREAARICESAGVNIASLAILFALSQSQVPCTILGMKNVEEVKRNVDLARRFVAIGTDVQSSSPATALEKVLTETEFKVWQQLQDAETGPFASVWKKGDFRWDGVQEAHDFWKQVPETKTEEWQTR